MLQDFVKICPDRRLAWAKQGRSWGGFNFSRFLLGGHLIQHQTKFKSIKKQEKQQNPLNTKSVS